ncbi:MAG: BMP family ABC transporter substrate-binding protein [Clostridiaceae bacterium]|nr:BMP family ABC transporter substrate-binding protein [Clostridiaceae bacterium]
MNKKRLIGIITTITIVGTLLGGCSSSNSSTSSTGSTETTTKKIKVGLSTDQGGLNDKSFNQAADAGIKKAQTEMGFQYKAIESKAKEDYESNLDALITEGNDIVFGIGFQMETAMENIAKRYPDKKFAIIDSVASVDPKATPTVQLANVESILFKENEGSFLVGVVAGKMTASHKVGFIGGIDMELIQRFETGFAAGVKSVDPEAAKGLIDRKTVKYAGSFTDTNIGYEAAKALINDGCDVIYHAAGGVGEGMFKAVKEANDGGKKVWAIGVDLDQSLTVPAYASVILTSMIKRVDTATYNVSKDVVNNAFKAGKIIELGLKEDGVGIAETSNVNVPKDVLDLVGKYSEVIKSGKLIVPAKKGEAASFVAPKDIK